ncbi:hypothetical protein GGR57DRAFT_237632 [Xylariaceae sp. FL1272]|nr:hypothetical protein GGR57DRAFT_237632 [Xylariaceae sp. FL1272]
MKVCAGCALYICLISGQQVVYFQFCILYKVSLVLVDFTPSTWRLSYARNGDRRGHKVRNRRGIRIRLNVVIIIITKFVGREEKQILYESCRRGHCCKGVGELGVEAVGIPC